MSNTPTTAPDVQTHQHEAFTIETRLQDGMVSAWCDLGAGQVMIWSDQPRLTGAGAHTAALIAARALLDTWTHSAPAPGQSRATMHAQVTETGVIATGTSPLLQSGAPVPARLFDAAAGYDILPAIADALGDALPDEWIPSGTTRYQLNADDLMRIYLGGQATDPATASDCNLTDIIIQALRSPGALPEGLSITTSGRITVQQLLEPAPAAPDHDGAASPDVPLSGSSQDVFAAVMADRSDIALVLMWLGMDPFHGDVSGEYVARR